MKYVIDNDLHIHSYLSSCSRNPEQTTERILKHAIEDSLKTVCVTDHFWDPAVPGASDWYRPQDFEHITRDLPLPTADGVRFLFGCETDMDKHFTLGISRDTFDKFDFVIIPTTHLHMTGFTIDEADTSIEGRARLYVERFQKLLEMDLPWRKIGVAHLTDTGIAKGDFEKHITVVDRIPDDDFKRLFDKAARLGVGIELNFNYQSYVAYNVERVLRPYRIAKACGCKFYLGSDAYGPKVFESFRDNFGKIVDALGLTEDDKFVI